MLTGFILQACWADDLLSLFFSLRNYKACYSSNCYDTLVSLLVLDLFQSLYIWYQVLCMIPSASRFWTFWQQEFDIALCCWFSRNSIDLFHFHAFALFTIHIYLLFTQHSFDSFYSYLKTESVFVDHWLHASRETL